MRAGVSGIRKPLQRYYTALMASARDIQRNYRDILERMKYTGQAALLMSQKEPQAAIVRLEDLEKLSQARRKNSAQALLDLAQEVQELLKDETLPI